jgi:hypothetical protein
MCALASSGVQGRGKRLPDVASGRRRDGVAVVQGIADDCRPHQPIGDGAGIVEAKAVGRDVHRPVADGGELDRREWDLEGIASAKLAVSRNRFKRSTSKPKLTLARLVRSWATVGGRPIQTAG